jgi:hypothetical protein
LKESNRRRTATPEIYFYWNTQEVNYIPTVSTAKSVTIIKEAKAKGFECKLQRCRSSFGDD